jgi:hypothetical protein
VIENKISGTDTGTLTTLTHQTLLNRLNKMGKQTQNAAAAHARAARWLANNPEPADTPETFDSEQHSPTAAQHFPICIDSDSDDDDCGYAGGVDVCLDSEKELEGMDENDEWSDTESLAELEGDKLEASLQALRPKLPITSPEEVTTPYDEIRGGKSAKAFAKAEKNRGFSSTKYKSHR